MNKNKKIKPEISKPTEEQIKQTTKMVKEKYDIVVPKTEAIKLVKLIKEMDWWIKADKEPASPKHVSEEIVTEFTDLVKRVRGKDITRQEAYDGARGMMVLVPFKEKQRIADEIRAILVRRREVLRNPAILVKTAKLLHLQYDIELTNSQLEQLVPYLSKTLWYEEGLDESLEKCLDDLLVYVDKIKRGKRANGLKLHDKMRQALDQSVKDLKLSGKDFDPLYRDND